MYNQNNIQSFFNNLQLEVQFNNVWISQEDCKQKGLQLEVNEILKENNRKCYRFSLKNINCEMFKLGGIRWVQKAVSNDFTKFQNPDDIRLYLEGWSMPSPCGVKKYGDCDYIYSPVYMKFAISEPSEYEENVKNSFRSDYALAIQNAVNKDTLLIGFVTSKNQYGRFKIKLSENGVSYLAITAGFDNRICEINDEILSEEIMLFFGNNIELLLEDFATVWGKNMNARTKAKLPVGWCSWYYYFSHVTENNMLENVDFLAKNKDQYQLEYIQLDDGYQPACGDWLGYSEKFPNGVGFWAKEAIKHNFKPAIWLAPFYVEKSSKLFKEHPEWCIKDENGEPLFPLNWRNDSPTAILDGTNIEVQEHFRKLFKEIRNMGFEYIKLDFMVFASSVRDGILSDKKATRAEALHRGLSAIREGFGDDGFILGCTSPFGPCIGLVDGERIATDITPYWAGETMIHDESPTVANVCRNDILHTYMHKKLFLNDPDTHIARTDNNELTENEVKLWTSALKMVGGMLLLSDRFQTLTPERAAYSKMLLSAVDSYNAIPLDRMVRKVPAVWYGENKEKNIGILGLFNFEDFEQSIDPMMQINSEMKELFTGAIVTEIPEKIAPHSSFVVEFSL